MLSAFLSCPFWSTILQCSALLKVHTLTTGPFIDCCQFSDWYLSVTLHIVDLWQYYVCCARSGVTWCTLFMGLYLGRMRQWGLHPLRWSHIGSLVRLLAAESRSTAELYFSCQYLWLCGTILLTLYSMVWDWRISRVSRCFIIGTRCSFPFCLLLFSLSVVSSYKLVLWGWVL